MRHTATRVAKWLLSREMESVNWVRVLDEAVCFSFYLTLTFLKRRESIYNTPTSLDRLSSLVLFRQPVFEKGDSESKPALSAQKLVLCYKLCVMKGLVNTFFTYFGIWPEVWGQGQFTTRVQLVWIQCFFFLLSYYLPIIRERTIGCKKSCRHYTNENRQFKIWTWVIGYISCDDNCFATSTFTKSKGRGI